MGARLNDVRIIGFRARDPEFRRLPRRPDPNVLPRYRWPRRTKPSEAKFHPEDNPAGPFERCRRCGSYWDQAPPGTPAGERLLVGHVDDPDGYCLCSVCHYEVMRDLSLHERDHSHVEDLGCWLRAQAARWPQRGRCRPRRHEGGAAPC